MVILTWAYVLILCYDSDCAEDEEVAYRTEWYWLKGSLRDVFRSRSALTLILLTWRIWWAPNNASKWQMEFNLAFKGLKFNCSNRIQRKQADRDIPSYEGETQKLPEFQCGSRTTSIQAL
jgi:hypothetical protein